MNKEEKEKIDTLFDRIDDLGEYADNLGLFEREEFDKLFCKILVVVNKIDSERGIDEEDLIKDKDINWP